jgi:hypothetical protein
MLQTVYSRRPGSESGRAGATRGITLKFQYCSMSPLLIQDCTALSGLAVAAAPGINNRRVFAVLNGDYGVFRFKKSQWCGPLATAWPPCCHTTCFVRTEKRCWTALLRAFWRWWLGVVSLALYFRLQFPCISEGPRAPLQVPVHAFACLLHACKSRQRQPLVKFSLLWSCIGHSGC